MGFFKRLKNKVRNQVLTMAEQPRRLPPIPPRSEFNPFRDPPREERRPMPTPVNPNIQSVREFVDNLRMPGRFRPLPQIIPERMPSRRPTPRFFGGGLRSIFAGLPQFMERFEDPRFRERMSPPLPRAPLPIPEDMPRERFPMMRPRFAEGEGVDINRIIADQSAREGISPAERRAESLKNFLSESGRIISDRDADLYGMGILSFEDVMRRAESARQTNLANEQRRNATADQGRTISNMDRNLMQQEQMFFPESESLDDILADLEKKN